MQAVINIALPFFALIFLGYGAGKSRLFGAHALAGLNTFAFCFALPALLVVKVSEAPMATGEAFELLGAYYLPGLLLFGLTFTLGRRLFNGSTSVGALQGLAATYSNVGFVGLPLAVLAFGTDAALPAVIIVIADTALMMGIAAVLIESDRRAGGGLPAIMRGIFGNPIIVAALIGLGMNLARLKLPEPALAFGELLADAAAPCALFALGATLAGRPLRQGAGETAFLTGLKLVVHPLLVAAAALLVFDLSPLWISVAILQASLPIAANVYVLAQRYEVHAGQISTAILVSTALAVFTVSGVLAWFHPGG